MTRKDQLLLVAQWEFNRFVKLKQQFIGLVVMGAVAGISCIRPTAPLGLTACALKPDSVAITALSRA